MTNWIDHDGSDECPIGREVRCYVRAADGEVFGPAAAWGWHWPTVRQYRIADDSALLGAPPETHAGEDGSYEPAPTDLTELRWQAALAALPAAIEVSEQLMVAGEFKDDAEAAEHIARFVGQIADAMLAERAKGGSSNG